MILNIVSIADRGDHEKERIVMRATADTDVGEFAVFRAHLLEDGAVSSDVSDVFWFPDKSIKSRNLVVLYTKKGAASERVVQSGRTVHFYYWGKSHALWSGSHHAPVLVYASAWDAFKDFIS